MHLYVWMLSAQSWIIQTNLQTLVAPPISWFLSAERLMSIYASVGAIPDYTPFFLVSYTCGGVNNRLVTSIIMVRSMLHLTYLSLIIMGNYHCQSWEPSDQNELCAVPVGLAIRRYSLCIIADMVYRNPGYICSIKLSL
jgi:hypothetical protein